MARCCLSQKGMVLFMSDNAKKFVDISLWLTAILLLVRFLISWTDVKDMWEAGHIFNLCYNFFGFIVEAIGMTAIVMVVFNKWAWRWRWLRWIHDVPVLAKNYNGTFISYGTAMLNVSNPTILEGNYFTGRKTRGSMMFEAIS